jgi:hypothetical protein
MEEFMERLGWVTVGAVLGGAAAWTFLRPSIRAGVNEGKRGEAKGQLGASTPGRSSKAPDAFAESGKKHEDSKDGPADQGFKPPSKAF